MLCPKCKHQKKLVEEWRQSASLLRVAFNTKNPSAHSSEPEGKSKTEVDQTPLSAEQIKVLLTKIGFGEGTKGWTNEQRKNARALLVKYNFLFAMDSMDLGKTDLVKTSY